MANQQKTTAPDNNKRLATLEAGVSSLAVALTANGIDVVGDPIESAIAAIKLCSEMAEGGPKLLADLRDAAGVGASAMIEIDKLERFILANHSSAIEGSAVDTAIALLGAAAAGSDNATEGEIAAIARAEKAEARVGELTDEMLELKQDVEDAMSEKNRLANLLADADKPATPPVDQEEAESVPAPVTRERPEAARDVGPSYGGGLTADEIRVLIGEQVGFEIAFSNGQHEIVDFGPIAIHASELAPLSSAQFAVAPALTIRGAGQTEELHGAGLLLEGVQIAYCGFDPVIPIEPGQERKFDRALIFG